MLEGKAASWYQLGGGSGEPDVSLWCVRHERLPRMEFRRAEAA